MLCDQIVGTLLSERSALDQLIAPGGPGVYAFFLSNRDALPPFEAQPNGLVYIGKSANLAQRVIDTHFGSGKTGSSTVRRSFGAILKQQLRLTAIPRGRGRKERDFTNYRFDQEGEDRLSDWMRRNLMIAVCSVTNCAVIESCLINELRPVLNLTGWPNPSETPIEALRKACADEARQRRPAQ